MLRGRKRLRLLVAVHEKPPPRLLGVPVTPPELFSHGDRRCASRHSRRLYGGSNHQQKEEHRGLSGVRGMGKCGSSLPTLTTKALMVPPTTPLGSNPRIALVNPLRARVLGGVRDRVSASWRR